MAAIISEPWGQEEMLNVVTENGLPWRRSRRKAASRHPDEQLRRSFWVPSCKEVQFCDVPLSELLPTTSILQERMQREEFSSMHLRLSQSLIAHEDISIPPTLPIFFFICSSCFVSFSQSCLSLPFIANGSKDINLSYGTSINLACGGR